MTRQIWRDALPLPQSRPARLHDLNHDGRHFSDRSEFLQRAQRINRYAQKFGALGFRSAALYRNIDWYDALDFSYDMSIPNVDPQRGGCCTVLRFFVGKILELPVTATQDYTLFHILNDYSIRLWKQQISLIREKDRLVSFVIHPVTSLPKRRDASTPSCPITFQRYARREKS
jgi:hypothetical protein